MKNLSLWLFSVFFSFVSLSVYSRGLPDHLQQDAEFLMRALEKGNVDAYLEKKGNINHKDIKKIFQFINNNGDNILHFLVRLEQFEGFKGYNLDQLLIEEIQDVFDVLPSWKFMRFLTQGNNQGISPLSEAASSKYSSEYLDERRTVLSNHLSENVLSKIFSTPIPLQNRGLAYKAFQMVVGSYSWPWRTYADAMVFTGITAAVGGIPAYVFESADMGLGAGGAVALFACYVTFKRLSNLRRAQRLLSGPRNTAL